MALRARNTSKEYNPDHAHNMVYDGKLNQKTCVGSDNCRVVEIAWDELKKRREAYQDYYERCRNTESYADHLVLRGALKEKDSVLVKQITQRSKDRLEKNEYLPKLPYPDPDMEIYYDRLFFKFDDNESYLEKSEDYFVRGSVMI